MQAQSIIADANLLVVKVGSSLVTGNGVGLDQAEIANWAKQIAALKAQGKQVLLVSSGAVAEGMQRLGWAQRPEALYDLQAAAAVGQMGMVQMYESCFAEHQLHTAQILLTHGDLADRTRYLNARSTLRALLNLNVIPIVNENDTVVTDEIRFGDNDTLAALVANLVEADGLVILTDQQGLFTADPRSDNNASLIDHAKAEDETLMQMAGGAGSQVGTGGMATKVMAAKRAARSGAHTVIAYGREPEVLQRLVAGEKIGTHLEAPAVKMAARKQWLADYLPLQGQLTLDAGAVAVLTESGKSLLPVGVTAVNGTFSRGELVACCDPAGKEIARGLCNYNAAEVAKIMGQASSEISHILGYVDESELIHRDNLVMV